MKKAIFFLILFCHLFSFSGCTIRSREYREYYSHLRRTPFPRPEMQETDYFLVVLVDACHLDYTNPSSFFNSVAKHPSDGAKTGSVGHAWIYLQSPDCCIEGGHSGEGNIEQVCYFDGLMDEYERGGRNPVKYLWNTLNDGFFQKGSGGHRPTFAAKFDLTPRQFQTILDFIHPAHYPYNQYALTGSQCSSFVEKVLALIGLDLNTEMTMTLPSSFYFRGECIHLWDDPAYSQITFASPDELEKELIRLVEEGQAEAALSWYSKRANRLSN